MEKYGNLSGQSHVSWYETGENYIIVEFKDGESYLYNEEITGVYRILKMKQLAKRGQGLQEYINLNVRKKYAQKV